MDSVTQENVDRIMKDRDDAQHELEVLTKTTEQKMWTHELDVFEKNYKDFKSKCETIQVGEKQAIGGGSKTKQPKQLKKK